MQITKWIVAHPSVIPAEAGIYLPQFVFYLPWARFIVPLPLNPNFLYVILDIRYAILYAPRCTLQAITSVDLI